MIVSEIESFFKKLANSFRWIIVFLTKENCKNYVKYEVRQQPLRILANGPSLNKEMVDIEKDFDGYDYCLLNFTFRNPLFRQIRPQMYILADPDFFQGKSNEEALQCFHEVDWDMLLYIPYRFRKGFKRLGNPHIKLIYFHKGEYKGFENIKYFLFKNGLSMPRPENVVAAAIFNAINAGYQKVELYGVDHSWLQGLFVGDDNIFYCNNSHYYDKENSQKQPTEQIDVRPKPLLHEWLHSQSIAFEAYHKLRHYADRRGVQILNMTKGSYIDAFVRGYL